MAQSLSPGSDVHNVIDSETREPLEDAESQLYEAVALDQLDRVKLLIDNLHDDTGDWKGLLRKALLLATSTELAELLSSRGADIGSLGDDGSTVLMEATVMVLVEWLVSKGVDVEAIDNKGRTALRRTVELDDDSTKAKFLIEKAKANIEAPDEEGRTVLMTAVWKSRKEVFDLVLPKDGNNEAARAQDYRGRSVLHHMASDVERSYDYQSDPSMDHQTRQQDTDRDMMERLLTAGNEANAKDKKGRTCLHWAAALGCHGLLQIFLQSGEFKVDETEFDSKTPLHLAAAYGHDKCVEALLRETADVGLEDDGSWTPLHNACDAENDVLRSVELLLERKADPSKKTRNGRTPLHIAAGAGNVEIVRMLLKRNDVNRNARDMFGNTPVLYTANIADSEKRRDFIKLFAPWQSFNIPEEDAATAAKLWNATIVDFRPNEAKLRDGRVWNSGGISRISKESGRGVDNQKSPHCAARLPDTSVFKLLYERDPKNDQKPAQTVSPPKLGSNEFRWIHLPANNVTWCQDLFTKYYVEENTMDVNSFMALERSFNRQRGGRLPQSRYMSSICQPVLRPWGNEEGGRTFGDRTEGLTTRSNTIELHRTGFEQMPPSALNMDALMSHENITGRADEHDGESHIPPKPPFLIGNDGPSDTERQARREADNKKIDMISDRTETNDSARSGSDDRELSDRPQSPTKNSKNDDVSISDFYVFMPYLHFETYAQQKEMSNYFKHFTKTTTTDPKFVYGDDWKGQRKERDVMLLRSHVNSPEHSLHIRRTLDQSFYHDVNTDRRDDDQVIHRFQKRFHDKEDLEPEKDDSKILMVDQLWMWVLGEKLIVTSFPTRWDQPKKDPLNLLDYVLSIIDLKNREPVRNVYELAMIISGRCYGAYDRHGVGSEDPHFLDMFEGWISAAMDDEVKLFEFFKRDSAEASKWLRNPHSLRIAKRRERKRLKKLHNGRLPKTFRTPDFKVIQMPHKVEYPSTEESFVENLLDIGWETTLLEEVKDVQDELGMLKMVFERQEHVRGSIKAAVETIGQQKHWPRHQSQLFLRAFEDQQKTIAQPVKDADRMTSQAKGIYNSVRDLLDLKQKHANAIEARYAREQTDDTSSQGKTLTVFTTVTTIFLPISFIAAFFAINIKELHHDVNDQQILGLGFVLKFVFGIGVSIAIICVIVALTWEDIWTAIQEMWKKVCENQDDDLQAKGVSTSAPDNSTGSPRDASVQAAGGNSTSNSLQNSHSGLKARGWRRRNPPKDEESATSKSDSKEINGNVNDSVGQV